MSEAPAYAAIDYQAYDATGPALWLAKPDGTARVKLLNRATPLDWKR